jgi:hypothetical protein
MKPTQLFKTLALLAALPSAMPAQQRESPGQGYQVQARLITGPTRSSTGELISVTRDSLWIREASDVRAMALGNLEWVRVRHHGFTFGKAMTITVLGGLITGGALTAACSSVSDDCGSVFLGMMGSWLVVGAIASASSGSAYRDLAPPSREILLPYARHPQGPPPGVELERIVPVDDLPAADP